MNKYYLIAGSLMTVAGYFTDKASLQKAAKKDDGAVVVTNPADIAEALTEPQMRRIRADIAARLEGAEDPESLGGHLFRTSVEYNTKTKKPAQAQKLFDALREYADYIDQQEVEGESGVTGDFENELREQAPKAPRAPRMNVKKHLRDLFPAVGVQLSQDDVVGDYSQVSITTALSDLRNEKYAGAEGTINIKRLKLEDGTLHYARIA